MATSGVMRSIMSANMDSMGKGKAYIAAVGRMAKPEAFKDVYKETKLKNIKAAPGHNTKPMTCGKM